MEDHSQQPDEGEYCQRCDLHFPNWDALHMHKISSGKHMACVCCGREFVTIEGCNRHQRQDHAHEQNIKCPGCGQIFKRAGGYINHIETQQCKVIKKSDLDRRRQEKIETKQALLAREDEDFDGPLTFSDPPLKPSSWIAWDSEDETSGNAGPDTQNTQDFPSLPSHEYRHGGSRVPDLLTGDSPIKLTSSAPVKAENVPPKPQAAWNSGKNLFPKAPKAVQPPAELLDSLTKKNENKEKKEYDIYDPDQPGFNLEAYYNPLTSKYRCAHPGCNKTHKSSMALYQHLKSSAHTGQKLRCPCCLRLFGSATALVQHAESQAVKCNIRESDEYRQAVDMITGGFVDTAGRHSDNTIRYRATGLEEGDPARTAALNKDYWEKREAERLRMIADASRNARW